MLQRQEPLFPRKEWAILATRDANWHKKYRFLFHLYYYTCSGWNMDKKTKRQEDIHNICQFLNAATSPSTYPWQWVGRQSFYTTLSVASATNIRNGRRHMFVHCSVRRRVSWHQRECIPSPPPYIAPRVYSRSIYCSFCSPPTSSPSVSALTLNSYSRPQSRPLLHLFWSWFC